MGVSAGNNNVGYYYFLLFYCRPWSGARAANRYVDINDTEAHKKAQSSVMFILLLIRCQMLMRHDPK